MGRMFLVGCMLALGAAGCGKADCAAFAHAYCDRAINGCGVPCTESLVQDACNAAWGPNCDMSPCVDAVKAASCNDPTFACVAKCPT